MPERAIAGYTTGIAIGGPPGTVGGVPLTIGSLADSEFVANDMQGGAMKHRRRFAFAAALLFAGVTVPEASAHTATVTPSLLVAVAPAASGIEGIVDEDVYHATTEDPSGTSIVYSDLYLKYLSLFPGGYSPNGCELAVALSGTTGVCTTEFAPLWFYPDGTTGEMPWIVDPSSPTGWSIERNPCAEAFEGTDPETDWWSLYMAYLDWVLGWTETRPEGITDLQGNCLIQIYGF